MRFAAELLVEGDGFEPSVPVAREAGLCGGRRIAWGSDGAPICGVPTFRIHLPPPESSDELPIARPLDLLTALTEPSPNQSSRCSAPGRCASERSGSRPNHEPRLAVPTDKRALHKGKPRRGTPGFSGRTIGIGEHRSPACIKQHRAAIVQVDNFWVRCRPAPMLHSDT